MRTYLILSALFCLFISKAMAQEILTGIQLNEEKFLFRADPELKSGLQEIPVLTLPFFDDFSDSKIYPDTYRWTDQFVFINKDFPIYPINSGAATFDVIDNTGRVYEQASTVPFIADYLTSRPIRLDSVYLPAVKKLTPSDSVYFSFYYQPQGRGDKPEHLDSLVLQFGYPSGRMILDFVDSITIPVDLILLENSIEFINPTDTVYSPEGCTEGLYLISNRIYTWGDDITLPCDSVYKPEILWRKTWSTNGQTFEDFFEENGSYFKQVLIPITDTLFFTSKFQFRFYNYGSIAGDIIPGTQGNVDQWNIDFVYLNHSRSINDIYYEKVTFSDRAPSFLKRYESMPYRQYRAAPTVAIKPEIELKITNISSTTKNTRYRYDVHQISGNQYFAWDGGNCNLDPYLENGFQTCATGCGAKHSCPPVTSLFALDFDMDTTSFLIRHFISDSSGTNPLVDSLVYRQGFYNYFAYDDGTPEKGYGLEPRGAYLAMQFTLNTPDTLRGVQMLFNRTLNESNDKFFDLVVWKDNNGIPGEIIYRQIRQRPQWSDDLYGFHLYNFDQPLILNGTFYVGLMQEDAGSMNIGFDAVNNSKQYLFLNFNGFWENSNKDGSVMIRPVVGSSGLVSLDDKQQLFPKVLYYPNPTDGMIHFDVLSGSPDKPESISIHDLTGRSVFSSSFSSTIDVRFLPAGFYLLRLVSNNNIIQTSKILISK